MTTINIIALFCALVSAVAAAISAGLTYRIAKSTKKDELQQKLNDILKLGIQYPQFENKAFTSQWKDKQNQEEYLRYDMYCNLIYNYLHDVYDFYDGDKSKIEDFLDVRNWVRIHEENWKNPVDKYENIDGYDKPFRDFINNYLD